MRVLQPWPEFVRWSKMHYIDKTTKVLVLSQREKRDSKTTIAVTDAIVGSRNSILYYRKEYAEYFESPVVIAEETYKVFRVFVEGPPLLVKNKRIFNQIFPNIFVFYEEESKDAPALGGVCKL